MSNFTKWVACFGNATSITEQVAATYTKNLTLRYPVKMCFDGDKLRFHFSNLTGTEKVSFKANIARVNKENEIFADSIKNITLNGKDDIEIEAGKEILTDEIDYAVTTMEVLAVSMYFESYTQLNAGTLVTGPLSKGYYSYGNFMNCENLPIDLTRNTNWYYFLNTIDIRTEEKNHALICYGDSITAQDWPDYLMLRAWDKGFKNVSIIRRAVCGTRILRQYDCITYASYGLKGETRFPIESNVSGADAIIIQHGINDIIHPVGTDINKFRPMSDLPTAKMLEEAFEKLYINPAKKMELKVYAGTLLPIYGWRTYEQFREDLKNEFNDWLRNTDLLDGCIDFDKALQDEEFNAKFKSGYDSGDHLHPSSEAYKKMAEIIPEELL